MTGVGLNPTRTGFLDVLRRMGADVNWKVTGTWSGEPVGTITAAHSSLTGTGIGPAEVPACIDELPVLAVAAAFASGTTTISGAGELRVKESDRLSAMAGLLSAFGAPVQESPDGLVIEGGRPANGARVVSRGDHRMAMAAAIFGLAAEGTTTVEDTANIATSDPGFERNLRRLTRGGNGP
jgi:3-phosphoshikimate 1-carboxyvinyltransferase